MLFRNKMTTFTQPKPEQHLLFVALQHSAPTARFKGTKLRGRNQEPKWVSREEISLLGRVQGTTGVLQSTEIKELLRNLTTLSSQTNTIIYAAANLLVTRYILQATTSINVHIILAKFKKIYINDGVQSKLILMRKTNLQRRTSQGLRSHISTQLSGINVAVYQGNTSLGHCASSQQHICVRKGRCVRQRTAHTAVLVTSLL